MHNKFIVIAWPSWSWKDTLRLKIQERLNYSNLISTTSRDKRDWEVDGVDYIFLTRSEFKKRIDNNKFIEFAEFNNNYYWKEKKSLIPLMENHLNIITILELKGVLSIIEYKDYLLENGYELIICFLDLNNETIRERMLYRGDDINIINKRINNNDYDYFQEIKNYANIILDANLWEEDVYENFIHSIK